MKFIVFDDDPTGSQTVHDCLLLRNWDCSTLVKGFESKSNLFFILANTRSLSENDAKLTIEEICINLKTVIASKAYEEDIIFMGLNEEVENNESINKPSSEWRFHRDIYVNKKDAQAIVHAHSPHATAVSSHGKSIPPFHYMIALAGGEDIKCAEYATFGTKELSQNVIKALENRSACLMSNHGQVAFGKNLDQAFELAQEIENICHQYTIALKLGEPKILSLEEMKKVLEKAKDYKKG